MHSVHVTMILKDWDMRGTYLLLEHAHVDSLEQNEVLLAINTRRPMVRFIDIELGVHTYYSPYATRFDLDKLQLIRTRAIGLKLEDRSKLRRLKKAA